MQVPADRSIPSEAPLQLLLFVDRRPSSAQHIRQIRNYLKELETQYNFDLQVVDVGEQPYLAEQFKLVASPALIKIHPEPRHTLAGSNIVAQVENFWSRWQQSVADYLTRLETQPLGAEGAIAPFLAEGLTPGVPSVSDSPSTPSPHPSATHSMSRSAELIQLSDEIFCLKQEKEELKEQLKFKDRIIAMLAHDLRNPLTAAAIALETLELSLNPKDGSHSRLTPEMTAQLLKHGRTQTRAIDRMITNILHGARDRSAKLSLQPLELELGSLCQEVVDYVFPQVVAKRQHLETDIPSDLPRVYADLERVRQVLINLLDNAIKYTPESGLIQLAILHRTSQKVQVSICDNGPGIPEENQLHIFEDHFRLERDEAQSGYGIGLSLCQRIVRAHYGQIWVDSLPGQGSCFNFTLPVYRS
ncbi:histidine kinase [Neosynechococcus sphagnicola sy1]|uniref:Adaptive-response sensory-kinase SasA n=1 Tax=Neosynechococcus sphagnicola sy1 TaxID=1497020 RepID=A0A098TME6_9CYAN|nr:histidine kinase [Neosynechococcus sphagnicola]KGF73441.1 histidine kinase [Neosynechococcus sphagnicola sy1]